MQKQGQLKKTQKNQESVQRVRQVHELAEEQGKLIQDLAQEGILYEEIAAFVGVSETTVRRYAVKAGISKAYTKICSDCGKKSKKYVLDRCASCHVKHKRSLKSKSKCHSERQEFAAGYCRQCYRKGCRKKRALCHSERVEYKNDLCRKCWSKLPDIRRRAIKVRRLKKYGLTEEEYAAIVCKQENVCAVCKIKSIESVDHCHKTNRVRGLLCQKCNLGLGHFEDNISFLKQAIEYLEKSGIENETNLKT